MKANCTNPQWIGRSKCSVCHVRNFLLFAGLSEHELDEILLPIDNLHAPAGVVLYAQDAPATNLFTVRSGLVKLQIDLPNGSHRIVRVLRPGDILGLEALTGDTYRHSAVVLQEADLCRIPRAVVTRLDKTSPQVHQALLERWQRSVDQADHFIVALSTGPAEARMARLLIMLGCTAAQPETIPSREDMGALLGITTETASRIIAEFKRRGLIHSDRGGEVVCDSSGLNKLANGDN